MKKLHFDAPIDWAFTYEEGYEDVEDEDGCYADTVYLEKMDASNRQWDFSFHVTAFHNCATVGAYDLIEPEVCDYLNNIGLVAPEYLIPSPQDLIGKCVISGFDAYYYLIQKPGEENADIRMIFDTPDNCLIYIDASISDWREDDLMIAILAEHLSFR